jgi:hypothetical protein
MFTVHFARESYYLEDYSFLGDQRIRKSSPLVRYTMFHRFSLSQRLLRGVPLLFDVMFGHKQHFHDCLNSNS